MSTDNTNEISRRSFVKKAVAATAGAFITPYILPAGRLFAPTGSRRVNHVVFCLFAGGIRNMESVQQDQSNLMSTMLRDIGGGFSPQAGIDEMLPSSPLGMDRLQDFGTLMSDFRFRQGPTGHYSGHMTAMTGVYNTGDINIRSNPPTPTIFELYRKHADTSGVAAASQAWWISDSLGPYPALNYSSHPDYGAQYGANYLQPSTLFTSGASSVTPQDFSNAQWELANKMKGYCDSRFAPQVQNNLTGISNTAEDVARIESFITGLLNQSADGSIYAEMDQWGFSQGFNSDLTNIFYTEKVIQEFQPELLVCNLQDVDICHSDFTTYCNALRRADWAVSHLWNTIQSTPGMANDTALIIVPEHGRNASHNNIYDAFGRPAYDHTNDDMSREIFCMVCGPDGVVRREHITQEYGESIDIVPTIAELLGFWDRVPSQLKSANNMGKVLSNAII